jgi:hypothetical protein
MPVTFDSAELKKVFKLESEFAGFVALIEAAKSGDISATRVRHQITGEEHVVVCVKADAPAHEPPGTLVSYPIAALVTNAFLENVLPIDGGVREINTDCKPELSEKAFDPNNPPC